MSREHYARREAALAREVAFKRSREAPTLLKAFQDGMNTADIADWAEMPEASVVLLLDHARRLSSYRRLVA